jgi:hypothetical protein
MQAPERELVWGQRNIFHSMREFGSQDSYQALQLSNLNQLLIILTLWIARQSWCLKTRSPYAYYLPNPLLFTFHSLKFEADICFPDEEVRVLSHQASDVVKKQGGKVNPPIFFPPSSTTSSQHSFIVQSPTANHT